MKISFKNPILKNIGASAFGILINLFNQIILIPFYLIYWGKDLYSDWIVLTAFSSFLLMSDLGLSTVITNKFSIEFAKGKLDECKKLLINNYFFILIIALFTLSILFFWGKSTNLVNLLNLNVIDNNTAIFILLGLTTLVFMNMLSAALNAIYRAVSQTAKGIIIDNIAKLFEVIILFCGIILGWNILLLILMYMMPKFILLFFKYNDTQKIFTYNISIKYFNPYIFKGLIKPSLSFMAFPIGNAIINQGYILLINKYFSSSELILYTTTRTLVNFIKTAMGTIATASWPEITNAFGKNDFSKMRSIHRLSVVGSFFMTLIISLILLFLGKYIYMFWTKGLIDFNFNLMLAFLIVLIANNFWYTSSVILMGTNNHQRLGIYYFVSSLLALIIARFLIVFHSLPLIVLSLIIMDIVLSSYTLKSSLKLTHDNFKDFLIGIKYEIKKYI